MPDTTVARTKVEVDQALSSKSDEVVIEGDDELINYAQGMIATLNRPPAGSAAPKRRSPAWIFALLILIVAVGAVILFSSFFLAAPSSLPTSATNASYPASYNQLNLMPLVWAFIVLVAIVLMYLLARQAIAGGSNVMLQWKVTEKMQGKLTVTRAKK